jgi:hypothetical protein
LHKGIPVPVYLLLAIFIALHLIGALPCVLKAAQAVKQ